MSIAVSTSTDKIIVDKSRNHRNKAVSKAVRATRQRLQTGSSVPAGFDREMLLLHIDAVLHGAVALPLLVGLISAIGLYLSEEPSILLWGLMALSAHAVTVFLARKAKRQKHRRGESRHLAPPLSRRPIAHGIVLGDLCPP
ncbi:hypothetical protein ABIA25_001397 [Sinorhizobium fredii]